MSNLFPHSTSPDEQSFSAGGFAPWSQSAPQPSTTARTVLCLVASSLFCASLIVVSSAVGVLLSPPAAVGVPAYVFTGSKEPEGVFVTSVREEFVMRGRGGAYGGRNANVFGAAGRGSVEAYFESLRERDNPTPPAAPVEPVDPAIARKALLDKADLSEAQMFAMMNMSGEHRHQAIWHYARVNLFAIPPFSYGTFLQLKDLGYALKPEGEKYHRLSVEAFDLANAVADHLQKLHSIHAPIIVHSGGRYSRDTTFRCTCGYRAQISTWNLQKNASRVFTQHLISVNTVAKLAEAVTIAPRQGAEEG